MHASSNNIPVLQQAQLGTCTHGFILQFPPFFPEVCLCTVVWPCNYEELPKTGTGLPMVAVRPKHLNVVHTNRNEERFAEDNIPVLQQVQLATCMYGFV